MKWQRSVRRLMVYALATIMAAWVMVPIYLITVMAFSTREGVRAYPKPFFPNPISTDTLQFFLGFTGTVEAMRNSVVVALLTLVLSMAVGAPAGYALARYVFRGRDTFRILIVSTRAFPIVILSVPLAVTFLNIGLYDTVLSVALMHTALALPFTILVTASVFAGVPKELEEAAMTLGCSRFGAFRRISLPLTLPGLAAAAIFTFVLSWNEVFAASILTLRNRTLPAHVLAVLTESPLPFQFAGGFFLMLPALIFMLFIRRYLFNLWGRVVK
ncbi:MAG: carbohydrate ABC transporter permease [Ardenticatenia bacterium]|nr:MAG: carbohydrate ABC transporter permease [Ardenticatenia bacterium]